MLISRRSLFIRSTKIAAGCSALAMLAGCGIVTTATTGGVTTVTLNVAKVNSLAQSLSAALTGLLDNTTVKTLLGTTVDTALANVSTEIAEDMAAFNTYTGGQTSLVFTASSIPAAVTALQTDAKTILANVEAALVPSKTSLPADALAFVNTILTIAPLVVALA